MSRGCEVSFGGRSSSHKPDAPARAARAIVGPPSLARRACVFLSCRAEPTKNNCSLAFHSLEQRHAGREAVDEVLDPNRSQLALGEETGQRHIPGFSADAAGVMVRSWEHPRAAAVATEQ